MQRWYLRDDGRRVGPLTSAELKERARTGRLQPTDLVLVEGGQQWLQASTIKGLFAGVVSVPPPATSPAGVTASVSPRLSPAVEVRALQQSPAGGAFLSALRTIALLFVVAVLLAGAWFYWDAKTLRERLQDKDEKLTTLAHQFGGEETAQRGVLRPDDALEVLRSQLLNAKETPLKLSASRTQLESTEKQLREVEKDNKSLSSELSQLKEALKDWQKKAEEQGEVTEKLQLRLKALESSRGPNAAIDRYALRAPPEAEETMEGLVRYLVKPALTEREKFRALFRWVADRIAYNMPGYEEKKYGDNSAEGVFKNRLGVCEGYARLLKKLCDLAEVETVVVIGYGKGVGYSVWEKVQDANHAWNAVKLDGKWYVADATWSAGHHFNGKERTKHYSDTWYLTRPEEFVITHYPLEPKWQLLDKPLPQKFGDKLIHAKISPLLFNFGVTLEAVVDLFDKEAYPAFVDVVHDPQTDFRIQVAPLRRNLPQGVKVMFQLEAKKVAGIALFNNNRWTALVRNGPLFQGEIQPVEGVLAIGIKRTTEQGDYERVLRYFVE